MHGLQRISRFANAQLIRDREAPPLRFEHGAEREIVIVAEDGVDIRNPADQVRRSVARPARLRPPP